MRSPLPSNFGEMIEHYTPRIALQFSGGRDSLAMLLLLKPWWEKLAVYYCNSGDAFPETTALIERLAPQIPYFIEVKGRVHQTRATDGIASDILPSRATWGFQTYKDKLKIVGREVCCYKSIMLPLQAAMRADGIKLILRGQRLEDEPKSPLKSGTMLDGFMLYFPIEEWSIADVEAYIREAGEVVPPYYREGMTSAPDCMECTAWLEHGGYAYIRKHHPESAAVVKDKITWLVAQTSKDTNRMKHISEDKQNG